LAASRGAAQAYPARPVTLVVPFASGGPTDILARIMADAMGERLGARVVVDNRAGAGGTIGSAQVARAAPDGYTLLLSNIASQGIAPAAYRSLPYEPVGAFTHIGLIGEIPNALVANVGFPARDFAAFLDHARRNPGLTYATGGVGTSTHLSAELLAQMARIRLTHVPYRGSAPAVTDVISNQVPLLFNAVTGLKPHIDAGRLRVLAVTGARRSNVFPEVPTVAEAGLPGYEAVAWFGISGPASLPPDITARLNEAINQSLADQAIGARLLGLGVTPVQITPDRYRAYVAEEVGKWQRVGREINLEQQ
jgi:tripartite-type tricarboxylate transporter receptor subunit TctC